MNFDGGKTWPQTIHVHGWNLIRWMNITPINWMNYVQLLWDEFLMDAKWANKMKMPLYDWMKLQDVCQWNKCHPWSYAFKIYSIPSKFMHSKLDYFKLLSHGRHDIKRGCTWPTPVGFRHQLGGLNGQEPQRTVVGHPVWKPPFLSQLRYLSNTHSSTCFEIQSQLQPLDPLDRRRVNNDAWPYSHQ
jgi:hypothetical protein